MNAPAPRFFRFLNVAPEIFVGGDSYEVANIRQSEKIMNRSIPVIRKQRQLKKEEPRGTI